jgi:hypothetical protein
MPDIEKINCYVKVNQMEPVISTDKEYCTFVGYHEEYAEEAKKIAEALKKCDNIEKVRKICDDNRVIFTGCDNNISIKYIKVAKKCFDKV